MKRISLVYILSLMFISNSLFAQKVTSSSEITKPQWLKGDFPKQTNSRAKYGLPE